MHFTQILIATPFALLAICGLVRFAQRCADHNFEGQVGPTLRAIVQGYRDAGHPNPQRAAVNEITTLAEVERFRRWACAEFCRIGTDLQTLKEEWWKANREAISNAADVAHTKSEAALYIRVLRDTIFTAKEDDIFVTPGAANRWKQQRERTWGCFSEIDKPVPRSEILDHVMTGLVANHRKNKLRPPSQAPTRRV